MSYSPLHLFKTLLDDGFKKVCADISLPTQAYIRDLLIYFIPSHNLFDSDENSGQKKLKTLAETYLKAQEVSLNERLFLLRKVGDQSLYLGGFFKESLNKRLVNLDYYTNMGQRAYESLAVHENCHKEVFGELSSCFLDIVDVLEYVSQKNSIQNNKDLLKLFKNYLRTGSPVLKRQLEDHGFCLQEISSKTSN